MPCTPDDELRVRHGITFIDQRARELAQEANIRLRPPSWERIEQATTPYVPEPLYKLTLATEYHAVELSLKHEWLVHFLENVPKLVEPQLGLAIQQLKWKELTRGSP